MSENKYHSTGTLIKRANLNEAESLAVINKLYGVQVISQQLLKVTQHIKKFMQAVKELATEGGYLSTTDVTTKAFEQAGAVGYTKEDLNRVRSHLGTMCRKGRVLNGTYLDAAEVDGDSYSNRLFRPESVGFVIQKVSESDPFTDVLERLSPSRQAPEPRKIKVKTEKRVDATDYADIIRDLNEQIVKRKDEIRDLRDANAGLQEEIEALNAELTHLRHLSQSQQETIRNLSRNASSDRPAVTFQNNPTINLDNLPEGYERCGIGHVFMSPEDRSFLVDGYESLLDQLSDFEADFLGNLYEHSRNNDGKPRLHISMKQLAVLMGIKARVKPPIGDGSLPPEGVRP